MASTSRAAAEAENEREARIARRTTATCLQHMLAHGRQSYLLMPSVLCIAALAVREGAAAWVAVWVVAWLARMFYVHRLVGRLRREPELAPEQALCSVVRGYLVAGVVAGALLPVFILRSDDLLFVVVTLLVTAYGTTMMSAASGVMAAALAYGLPTLGVLVLGWLWRGGVLGWGLAAFLVLLFALSLTSVRSQRHSLAKLVQVMDDNETLAAALARERDRSEAASAARTRFFAAASHDLRQPLHALSINAATLGLVAQRSGNELLRDISLGIDSALHQSRSLLDGLLDIARLDANAVQLQPAVLDLRLLLERVREQFAPVAAQRGLSLTLQVPAMPLWVHTDDAQLLRIVGNLVDNALKFTVQGGVALAAAHNGEGRVQLRITDTGPGIAPEEHDRVFEEFYQVGNPSRDRAQGLGLGLAIVARTARLLQVPLRLKSLPGHGATFELSFPAAGTPGMAALPPVQALPASTVLPRRVLVVDDEEAVLKATRLYLEQLGWQVDCARNGDAALQMLAQGCRPDALVVDYRLRRETGTEVIARVRKRLGGLPTVLVTGDSDAARLGERTTLDVDMVHKPLAGPALAAAVEVAINRVQSQYARSTG